MRRTGVVRNQEEAVNASPSVGALIRYFLRLGAVGFGGPAVLVERMRHDLQEDRGWFTLVEYKEGLALAQLAPGPLAAQLAIYLGWARAGLSGATLVGFAFILPSFLMVLALSAVYVTFGGLPWMQGAFYGVGAAVIALIAHSAWRLTRRTVGTDVVLRGLVGVNACVTAWTEREIVWLILASGAFALLWGTRARWWRRGSAMALVPIWSLPLPRAFWTTGLHGPQPVSQVGSIAAFFARAGAVVFGSGLAIVPFLHGTVVQQRHWLTERQFLDAVAVSMITPGPVVITVAFIGYLVAGPFGATAAAVGVFAPVYLLVVVLARWFHRIAGSDTLRLAVNGVTAAATGAIVGATVVLGRRAIVDVPTILIFLGASAGVCFVKRIPEPALLLIAAVIGLALHGPGGRP